jgi:NAD(P)-dependent dehydrogenase (short-subunit alcohol dehydrogenase family)
MVARNEYLYIFLSGKEPLVSGGNGGIGLSMALGLAKASAKVVIAGRNPAKGETAVRLLQETVGFGRFLELDISDDVDCAEAIRDLVEAEGRLDILVNNAGVNVAHPRSSIWPTGTVPPLPTVQRRWHERQWHAQQRVTPIDLLRGTMAPEPPFSA